MIMIGTDFHPGFQQLVSVDTETGEFQEKRLAHREEAERFYRAVVGTGQKIRVGMEASGYARWFERLLAEFEIGYGSEMRPRSNANEHANRRRTGKMRSIFCSSC